MGDKSILDYLCGKDYKIALKPFIYVIIAPATIIKASNI